MSREWQQPGQVASVTMTRTDPINTTKTYDVCFYDVTNDEWVSATHGRLYPSAGAWQVSGVRPLVVIDPEDREQVERLLRGFDYSISDGVVTDMQAALRSLTTPPKPEEPTGLGAVVEDARGVLYVRTEKAPGIRNPWSSALHPLLADEIESLPWSEVAAVKVLSQGWSE